MSAALNAMNSAVEGRPPAAAPPPPPPQRQRQQPAAEAPLQQPAPAPRPAGMAHYDGSDLSLRELVEAFAEEAGLALLPKPGRTQDGLQVYSFGGVSCTLDNAASAVRAQLGGGAGWAPVSLEALLAEHRRREAQRGAKR